MAALPSPQYPSRVLHVTGPGAMTQLGHQSAARATGQESKETGMARSNARNAGPRVQHKDTVLAALTAAQKPMTAR